MSGLCFYGEPLLGIWCWCCGGVWVVVVVVGLGMDVVRVGGGRRGDGGQTEGDRMREKMKMMMKRMTNADDERRVYD